MAQEDILPQIFAEIYTKANPQPPSDNQQLNKIEIPNDFLGIAFQANAFVQGTQITEALSDTLGVAFKAQASIINPSSLVWGGVNGQGQTIAPGWSWGVGGRWG